MRDSDFPLRRLHVAATYPGKRDQRRRLVDIQILDEFNELVADRGIGSLGQHHVFLVIRGTGILRLGARLLVEMLARLFNDEANFRQIDLRRWTVVFVDSADQSPPPRLSMTLAQPAGLRFVPASQLTTCSWTTRLELGLFSRPLSVDSCGEREPYFTLARRKFGRRVRREAASIRAKVGPERAFLSQITNAS